MTQSLKMKKLQTTDINSPDYPQERFEKKKRSKYIPFKLS